MARPKLGAKKQSDRVEVRLDRELFELTEVDRLNGRLSENVRFALKSLYSAGERDQLVQTIAKNEAEMLRLQAETKVQKRKLRAMDKTMDELDSRRKAEETLRAQVREKLAAVRVQASRPAVYGAEPQGLTVAFRSWLEARVRALKVLPLAEARRILAEEIPDVAGHDLKVMIPPDAPRTDKNPGRRTSRDSVALKRRRRR